MAAPVSIAHTHVHSLRILGGAEALVARVLTREGVAGYGFTLSLDAAAARDMAEWDALARSRNVPLYALFGSKQRAHVAVVCVAQPVQSQVDPFALGSVEEVLGVARAASDASLALVAPNAHAWELSYCAALAASLPCRDACIIVRAEPGISAIEVPEGGGIGIDWSLEPAFGAIRW
jgi:L-alanine-DL-glutamate epimerase-like enolase superfamily enzyme